MNKICKNCGSEYQANYCNYCGQRENSGRIVFADVRRHFFEEVFTLDGPLFITIKDMTIRPADLCRRYINGERKRYTKPLQYYLIMFIFYFLIEQLLNFDSVGAQMKAIGNKDMIFNEEARELSSFLSRNLNSFYFVYVFIFAFFSRFFYRHNGNNFAEYITIGLYLSGHFIFLSTFLVILSYLDVRVILLARVIIIIYSVWTLTLLDRKGHIVSKLSKSLLASILAYIFYIALSSLIAFQIIKLS